MRELNTQEKEIIETHMKWLRDTDGGERANLRDADLRGADLTHADLRGANLRNADLHDANLSYANLRNTDLRDANLSGVDLTGADLIGADLIGANLRGADIDHSCWPLWCGSLGAIGDEALCAQIAYHLARLMQNSGVSLDISIKDLANKAKQIEKYELPVIE